MKYFTKKIYTDYTNIARVITGVLLSMLSLVATAQDDCVDTYYLESDIVPAGKQVTYRAASLLVSKVDKFIVEDKGQATLTSGGRIELNPGFAILNGGGLSATIASCEDTPPQDPPKSTLTVFPNPTDGVLNIKSDDKLLTVRILDRSGMVVFEKTKINDTAFTLDISKAKAGIYVLEVVSTKTMEQLRIIKN